MDFSTSVKLIRDTIYKYLPKEEYEAFIFGSRATNDARKWSDVDVGILGKRKIPGATLEYIRGELEDSNVPFKVEVVDFARVPKSFKKLALKKIVEL